jgi:uncharacterized repeat protein (TIGR03803 family)
MRNSALYGFSISAAAALLAGCGGTQSGIPKAPIIAPDRTDARKAGTTPYFKSLYAFETPAFPAGGLINVNGTLYGTTSAGGGKRHRIGSGAVYSITTGGMEHVLYYFSHSRSPRHYGGGPMAALIDVNGKLYGTTEYGGKYGEGTVFRISTAGAEKVIHSFGSGPDGAYPVSRLLNVNGTLYGTTEYNGGSTGCGTVFSLTPSGSEHLLYSFNGEPDGCEPSAGLIDVNGTLYSTTRFGGMYGGGTVFSISTSGSEQVLHSFGSGSDGMELDSGLLDVNGTLYGSTRYGGLYEGTLYSISTSGSEQVLHNFGGGSDGQSPEGDLVEMNGTLYGTTTVGGTNGQGTIFSTSTTGSETVLHNFNGDDGKFPLGDLIALGGTLYGVTFFGGFGDGTVFTLTP